jgi:hypothetical protein
MIDLDALIPGSAYFRWREALWLPKWGIHVFPTPEQHKNIILTARNVADPIRSLFNKPMQIHSWLRPSKYNDWKTVGGVEYGVGGSPGSQHILGKAIDFSIFTVSIDEIHAVLEPRLQSSSWRMERPDGKARVHVDWASVPSGGNRYFNP